MPFVEYYKAARIRKARRTKRPEWQDRVPDTSEAKETFRIAAKYEDKFVRAFLSAVRNMLTPEDEKNFKQAFRSGSIQECIESIPVFREGATDDKKVWERFMDQVDDVYYDILNESGQAAARRLNKDFKINFKFTMEPLQKAEVPPPISYVPVNPYSVEWMKTRSLDLAKKTLAANQREVIREILEDSFERGLRAEKTYASIKANIGLNHKGPLSYRAVRNREALHRAAGLPEVEVKRLTDRYRNKLLKTRAQMIARTETIAANAAGRNQTWKLAQEAGQLPDVVREWIAAPDSPNPDRPCEQCEDLDGKTAKIGEPYESIEGPVDAPPAHPDCRCTETIRKRRATDAV